MNHKNASKYIDKSFIFMRNLSHLKDCDDAGNFCDDLGIVLVADIEIEESKEPLEV